MSDAIVLCADDYALTAPVSRSILTLAERGRLSAASCMTVSPHWREHAGWIAPLKDTIDIGLHLTLVEERPLTRMPRTAPDGRLPSIVALIAKSHAGALALEEIRGELAAQVQAFTDALGFAPAHLDGHLHAHVLPGIRDIVLTLAARISPAPWLRNVHDSLARIVRRGVAVPKAAFIASLGRGFGRRAAAAQLASNDGFSGVYGFGAQALDYGALFGHFLAAPAHRQLILCHPGAAADDAAWSANRAAEFAFLAGDALPRTLGAAGRRLTCFAQA